MNGITSSGAKGINALGPRYMGKYHPLMEIGPRYLLIQGTHRELTEGNGPPFVLDLPHIDRDILHHLQYDSMPGDKETWNDYCALCFMAAVWLMVFLKPGLAPRLPKSPLHERMASQKTGLPIMGIFFLVIGGIYGGVFTATEGGGIGAFGTLLLALCMRRMNGKNVIATLHDSAKFISMCFTVLCGAIVLSYFMAMTRIPMVLANSIAALDVAPMLVLFAIVMTFCILGCFLPSMPLLLICVPIFVPIAKVFGWDLIWFGVIITVLDNMASITVKSTDATHPQNGMSFGDLGETDLMEIGAGQHGEGGGVRVPMMSSKDTVATVAEALCKALDLKPGDKTFVMINGCGATTMMEMLVLFKDTVEFLKAKGIEVVASMVGEILTVQEAAGFQMNIAKWDDEFIRH